jgi:hypothetical protein
VRRHPPRHLKVMQALREPHSEMFPLRVIQEDRIRPKDRK